jgi:hypothetical protein
MPSTCSAVVHSNPQAGHWIVSVSSPSVTIYVSTSLRGWPLGCKVRSCIRQFRNNRRNYVPNYIWHNQICFWSGPKSSKPDQLTQSKQHKVNRPCIFIIFFSVHLMNPQKLKWKSYLLFHIRITCERNTWWKAEMLSISLEISIYWKHANQHRWHISLTSNRASRWKLSTTKA